MHDCDLVLNLTDNEASLVGEFEGRRVCVTFDATDVRLVEHLLHHIKVVRARQQRDRKYIEPTSDSPPI